MQKPKIKLEIVILLEFWVVFTVSSLEGNPVFKEASDILKYYKSFDNSPENQLDILRNINASLT